MQAEAERPRLQNLAANQQDPGEPTYCSVRQQGYTLTPAQIQENRHICKQTHIKESLKTHQMHIRNTETEQKSIDFYYKTSIMQLFS